MLQPLEVTTLIRDAESQEHAPALHRGTTLSAEVRWKVNGKPHLRGRE
ncbi:conserved hypothetical protein [Histoplasma capsulatum var. duboisii H88]|uniref:Uncharacterized protein n=2 Tax=Ajellomyces capsulatus TaxID=5037 RepID=F0UB15_AJEC8|nr:conserved hypothetical protein [Histoplasma capsulatum H143]EGC42978.1 conserved hypothetical protein [Histoplasma capsulatum var. duboisii H88]